MSLCHRKHAHFALVYSHAKQFCFHWRSETAKLYQLHSIQRSIYQCFMFMEAVGLNSTQLYSILIKHPVYSNSVLAWYVPSVPGPYYYIIEHYNRLNAREHFRKEYAEPVISLSRFARDSSLPGRMKFAHISQLNVSNVL